MRESGKKMPIINPELTFDWLIAHGTGKGIDVAVIDSGIDAAHPALRGKVKQACIVIDRGDGKIGYRVSPGEKSFDSFGHGSGVAGIILEIAPGVNLTSVKVLGENNAGSGEALIAGLKWALDRKIKLINLSLATTNTKFAGALFNLCEQAYVQDTILVVSKRNFGDLGYPAMFSSVISVDSEPFEDKYRVVHYSGKKIEYGARGQDVEVAQLGGSYGRCSGTSFATPHVTGLAALLLSVYPDARSCQIKAVLDEFSLKYGKRTVKKRSAKSVDRRR